MKRVVAIVVVVALVVAAVGGIVVLAIDDGPTAATVHGSTVSQGEVDDDLRAIGENQELRDAAKAAQAAPLSNHAGTVTAGVGAGWLTLVIGQELAAQAVERRGLHATSADRDQARQLAIQFVGGKKVFDAMPESFQDRQVERWTPVAVLAREGVKHPPAAVLQQLASQCPSGRYVAHILLETEAEALRIKQQLAAGADFATFGAPGLGRPRVGVTGRAARLHRRADLRRAVRDCCRDPTRRRGVGPGDHRVRLAPHPRERRAARSRRREPRRAGGARPHPRSGGGGQRALRHVGSRAQGQVVPAMTGTTAPTAPPG